MSLDERMQKSLDIMESLEKEGMDPQSILAFLCSTHALACGMFEIEIEDFSKLCKTMNEKYPIMYHGCKALKESMKNQSQSGQPS